jgi:hypothetical protein
MIRSQSTGVGQKQPLLSANEALWSVEFLRQRLLFAAACIPGLPELSA